MNADVFQILEMVISIAVSLVVYWSLPMFFLVTVDSKGSPVFRDLG